MDLFYSASGDIFFPNMVENSDTVRKENDNFFRKPTFKPM